MTNILENIVVTPLAFVLDYSVGTGRKIPTYLIEIVSMSL